MKCDICGQEFKPPHPNSKYCSRKCYGASRKGKKWGNHFNKVRGKYSEYQVSQIVKGKKRAYLQRLLDRIDEFPIDLLKQYAEETWVNSTRALSKIITGRDDRGYAKNLSYLMDYLDIHLYDKKVPVCYNTMTLEQCRWFKKLLYTSRNYYEFRKAFLESYKEYNVRYNCLNSKCLIELLNTTGIENKILKPNGDPYLEGCGSLCEMQVREILELLNVQYREQYRIKDGKKTYIPDFVFQNKVIEVNGDYWHFWNRDYNTLTKTEQVIYNRYKRKIDFYKQNNILYIEIWEHELKDITAIKEKISNFIDLKAEPNILNVDYSKIINYPKKQPKPKKIAKPKIPKEVHYKRYSEEYRGFNNPEFVYKWKAIYEKDMDEICWWLTNTDLPDRYIICDMFKKKVKFPNVIEYYQSIGKLQKTIRVEKRNFYLYKNGKGNYFTKTPLMSKTIFNNSNLTRACVYKESYIEQFGYLVQLLNNPKICDLNIQNALSRDIIDYFKYTGFIIPYKQEIITLENKKKGVKTWYTISNTNIMFVEGL